MYKKDGISKYERKERVVNPNSRYRCMTEAKEYREKLLYAPTKVTWRGQMCCGRSRSATAQMSKVA